MYKCIQPEVIHLFTKFDRVALPPALLWDITQRQVVALYSRFGMMYRSRLKVEKSKTSWPCMICGYDHRLLRLKLPCSSRLAAVQVILLVHTHTYIHTLHLKKIKSHCFSQSIQLKLDAVLFSFRLYQWWRSIKFNRKMTSELQQTPTNPTSHPWLVQTTD